MCPFFSCWFHILFIWSPSNRHGAWHIVVVQSIHVEHTWTAVVQGLTCSEVRVTGAEDQVCWSIIHTASFGWGINVSPDSHSLQSHKEDLKLKNLGLVHWLSAYRIKTPFVMHLLLKLNKFKKATECPPSHVFLSQQQTVWHILQITVVFWGSVLKNAALPTRALRALVVYFWALKEVKTGVVSDCRLIPHQLTGPFKTEICMSHRLHWKILLY